MKNEEMNKKQWQKPVVQKLDISKTKSGIVATASEGVWVGTTTGGDDLYGNDVS